MSDNSTKAFTDLLNTPADQEIKVPVTPIGSWRLTIKAVKLREPKDEDTPGELLYGFQPVEPQEDVDAEEVAVMGEELENTLIWHKFRLRDKKDARKLQKFLEAVGAELSGRSLIEAGKSVEGYEVIAYVNHDDNKNDPEMPYTRLSDFAPVGG